MLITIRRYFSKYTPYNHNIDKALKNYFNEKFNYSNVQISNIFTHISKQKKQKNLFKDHRWISLKINTEKNLNSFRLEDKLSILKALTKIGDFDSLFTRLIQEIQFNLQKLNIDELCFVLWVNAKKEPHNLFFVKKVCDQLNEHFTNKKIIILPSTKHKRNEFQVEDVEEHKIQTVYSMNLGLVLWSLSEMKVVDRQLIKFVVKECLQKEIQKFSVDTLCLIIYSLKHLGMQKNKNMMKIKNYLKQKQELLKGESILNLCHLVEGLCAMEEVDKNMVLWTVQTILKRQQLQENNLSRKMSSLLLIWMKRGKVYDFQLYQQLIKNVTSSIKEAKQMDLSMVIESIAGTPFQTELKKEERIVLDRIQKIYHGFHEKSKKVVQRLYIERSVEIPKELGQMLKKEIEEIEELEKMKKQEK